MAAPPAPERRSTLIVLVAVVMLVAACGTSGTDLREPPPGATAPAPTSSTTSTTAPAVFTVFSPAFPMAGEVPSTYTCTGAGVSPPVKWVGLPANTAEIALTVTTPAADEGGDPIVHWIVAGLPATTLEIAEDTVPLEGIEGPNSDGGFGWLPPCAEGEALSQMQLQLHALETASAIDPAMSAIEALDHLLSLPATRTISSGTVTADPVTTPPTSG